jgi:LuxR family maltose regulon positive regulatory protein
MQKIDLLIRTKLRSPFTRPELVPRPRLQARVMEGVRGPLTLIIAPAGFGKTTLVTSCITGCGMPMAWLSLDKEDNQGERFLNYLVAALQEVVPTVGSEAARLMAASQQVPPEVILTHLINDLDAVSAEMALVLDDYQFMSNQVVHESVAFLLKHCPQTFHLVIATRSDPPLPLARLRARGHMVELRAADLRFTESETAQFLNDVMGLRLDAGAVAALEERTEGWIAGLQMAALALQGARSIRDHKDVRRFIAGFSGTNRYILDYLLEEVLARQSPEVRRFLLHTSILERLSAPLCDAVLAPEDWAKKEVKDEWPRSELSLMDQSASTLAYLERANLFLVPLDDERIWYRYHHLFADLLRVQLQRSLGPQGVAQLHARASEWHRQNGSILEAIHHASMALDDERVERLIEQHYMAMVRRGEQSGMRLWTGKLSKALVYRRPWLCIYEAYSHAWFGELDEADRLLEEAEKHIRSEVSIPDGHAMQAHLAYIKSRVTAMRGNIHRAIKFCLAACEHIPASNLALQFDTRVTLGYEYFLSGDYVSSSQILNEAIRSGISAGAIIHTVVASCFMARLYAVQGLLHKSYDLYQAAAQLIPETSGEHRDARALVDIGMAEILYEWNDLGAALVHIEQGLALLPFWGKADDSVLAYVTVARIHLAQSNKREAIEAVEKAIQLTQTRGVFSEARNAVEIAQVKLWLALGDMKAAKRWAASQQARLSADDRFRFDLELAHIARARVWIAQHKRHEAIDLLARLEEIARASGRVGSVIAILPLKALALQAMGESDQAFLALTACLTLAEPEGYVRIFLDEGQPMQKLLAQWLAQADAGPLRDYATRLLSQFETEPHRDTAPQEKTSPIDDLAEPLSPRELEVLLLIAQGSTNKEIAQQLFIAPGTVKAHTSNIYRKLDVTNRTEAAARARQLGLLR